MRFGRMRAMTLVGMLTVAGAMPGGATVAGGSVPAGITASCSASAPGDAPEKVDGVLWGNGRGSCSVTGTLGAPWELRLTVRLQEKSGGAWRTRALTISRVDTDAATKRIRWLTVGLPCSGSTVHAWRVKVLAEATIAEKTEFVLETAAAVSTAVSLRC